MAPTFFRNGFHEALNLDTQSHVGATILATHTIAEEDENVTFHQFNGGYKFVLDNDSEWTEVNSNSACSPQIESSKALTIHDSQCFSGTLVLYFSKGKLTRPP